MILVLRENSWGQNTLLNVFTSSVNLTFSTPLSVVNEQLYQGTTKQIEYVLLLFLMRFSNSLGLNMSTEFTWCVARCITGWEYHCHETLGRSKLAHMQLLIQSVCVWSIMNIQMWSVQGESVHNEICQSPRMWCKTSAGCSDIANFAGMFLNRNFLDRH